MGTQHSAQKKIIWFRQRFEIMEAKDIYLNKDKLIAQFCLDNGSTPRTAKELLKMFETAGEIKIIGADIGSTKLIKDDLGITSTKQESLNNEEI